MSGTSSVHLRRTEVTVGPYIQGRHTEEDKRLRILILERIYQLHPSDRIQVGHPSLFSLPPFVERKVPVPVFNTCGEREGKFTVLYSVDQCVPIFFPDLSDPPVLGVNLNFHPKEIDFSTCLFTQDPRQSTETV